MSMIGSILKSSRSDEVAAEFIAFVADKESAQVLKSFVLEEALPHTRVAEGGINEAIVQLSKLERSPQILMVDLQGSDMPLSELERLASVCEPSTQVIALGERNDVGLYRSLLGIGISDYLVKPLTVGLLKRTVDLRAGRTATVVQPRTGKVLAFVGARGGVGTTTLSVNFARALAESRRRVIYVDLNLRGGAGPTMLGLRSNNGLIDVLQNVRRLDPAYVERVMQTVEHSRLSVLSAELGWGDPRPFEDGGLAILLNLLASSFHYVIVDIGDRADPLVNEALDVAARAYVVADRSVHAARETTRLLRFIETRNSNPATSVVLNNPNAATHGKVEPSDFAAAVGRPSLVEVPFEGRMLAIAENVGAPVAAGKAQGFQQGIEHLVNDLTGHQNVTGQRTFWQKLKLRK